MTCVVLVESEVGSRQIPYMTNPSVKTSYVNKISVRLSVGLMSRQQWVNVCVTFPKGHHSLYWSHSLTPTVHC